MPDSVPDKEKQKHDWFAVVNICNSIFHFTKASLRRRRQLSWCLAEHKSKVFEAVSEVTFGVFLGSGDARNATCIICIS